MLYGEADALNSSYHISYNMLLNMLRVEDADPDFLVKSSFHQFQQEASAPALEVSSDARLKFLVERPGHRFVGLELHLSIPGTSVVYAW